jgi:hypothetical protein
VQPETPIHDIGLGSYQSLGFQSLVDKLHNDMIAGALRPDQLKNISVADVVQRVHNEKEAAKRAEELAAEKARKANLMRTPYKEYPSGYKWITLPNTAESPESMKAVQDIGCQGGWCTKYDYNADAYGNHEEGNRLYALLDPSGKPHIQINSLEAPLPTHIEDVPVRDRPAYTQMIRTWRQQNPSINGELLDADVQKALRAGGLKPPVDITQIKPFSNEWDSQMVADAMKKNPYYRKNLEPYIQDFVRSGNWRNVEDLENTGLTHAHEQFDPQERQTLISIDHPLQKYLTDEEREAAQKALYEHETGKDWETGLPKELPPIEGDVTGSLEQGRPAFKRGGKVNLEDQYRLHKLNGTILGTQHRM